ncbi:MAG: zinc ribbon domain-containing protein [Desulfovibrionaceae bacterium]|nr:zinc ribbon domain-containing protein [Desulfovibrionaceae bacterium]
MNCRHCGEALPPNAKFCHNCGQKVVGCPNCGFADLSPKMKFCPECGAPVQGQPAPSQPQNRVQPQPQPQSRRSAPPAVQTAPQQNFCEPSDFKDCVETIQSLHAAACNRAYEYSLFSSISGFLRRGLDADYSVDISSDLTNARRVQDDFYDYLKECINYKFYFFNNFLMGIPLRNQNDIRPFLVDNGFIEKHQKDVFYQVSSYLKEVEMDLPLILSQLQQAKSYDEQIRSRSDDKDTKTGLMVGAMGLATLVTGGLAAPIMAAAGFGSAIMSESMSIDGLKEKFQQVVRDNVVKAENLERYREAIANAICEIEAHSILQDLPEALSSTCNILIKSGKISAENLSKYNELFADAFVKLLEKDRECIDAYNREDEFLDNFIRSKQFEDMSNNLSEGKMAVLCNQLDARTAPLTQYLDEHRWWQFPVDIYNEPQIPSIPSLNDIIRRYGR